MNKKQYIQPQIEVITMSKETILSSTTQWNDVGNFGFGDDEDDDREGDDNWEHNWNWP